MSEVLRAVLAMSAGAIRYVGAAALVLAALGLPPTAQAQTYGFATLQPGTLNHTTASAVAKVLKEKAGMNVLVQPTAGDKVIIPMVGQRRGRDRHHQRRWRRRTVWRKAPRICASSPPCTPCASPSSCARTVPVRTVADLRGKRVPYGFSAMRALDPTVRAMLATAGLSEKDIKPVLVPNVVRSADEFISGAADMLLLRIRRAEGARGRRHRRRHPATEIDEQGMPAARKIMPWGYLTEVAPGPIFIGVEKPMKVYSFDNVLFTHAKVRDDLVYKILDTMEKNKDELDRRAAGAARVLAGLRLQAIRRALSSGALKYFKERNLTPRRSNDIGWRSQCAQQAGPRGGAYHESHRARIAARRAGFVCANPGERGGGRGADLRLRHACSPATLNHTTSSAIAKVLKEKGDLNTLVQPTAGET